MIEIDHFGFIAISSMPGTRYFWMCFIDDMPPHAVSFSIREGLYTARSTTSSPPFQ
jgi:hypothetical protein